MEHNDLAYNVVGLLRQPVGSTRAYEWSEPELRLDEHTCARDLAGGVRLLRISKGILAIAQAEATVAVECAQCLTETAVRVEAAFEEEFRPSVDLNAGAGAHVLEDGEEEDDFFRLTPAHELDLREATRQALLLNLPYSPLCRADCRGLCPHCGADLNAAQCGCETTTADSRLAGLSALLDQLEDDTNRRTG